MRERAQSSHRTAAAVRLREAAAARRCAPQNTDGALALWPEHDGEQCAPAEVF